MTYLLQLCGLSDPVQLFYLEQHANAGASPELGALDPNPLRGSDLPQAQGAASGLIGPAFAGFRPFQLDQLLSWAQDTARCRGWDLDAIQGTVLAAWLERAEAIDQWQRRLREAPADRCIVAGLGSQRDWQQRCEGLLRT
jgi:hypothetical protein